MALASYIVKDLKTNLSIWGTQSPGFQNEKHLKMMIHPLSLREPAQTQTDFHGLPEMPAGEDWESCERLITFMQKKEENSK